MSHDECVVVFVTAASSEEAERLARALVEERLAACATIGGPVRSIYRWEGAVHDANEWTLMVKARRADVDAIVARVRALHSYDTPEVVALPIVAGCPAYLAWLESATVRPAAG